MNLISEIGFECILEANAYIFYVFNPLVHQWRSNVVLVVKWGLSTTLSAAKTTCPSISTVAFLKSC